MPSQPPSLSCLCQHHPMEEMHFPMLICSPREAVEFMTGGLISWEESEDLVLGGKKVAVNEPLHGILWLALSLGLMVFYSCQPLPIP